MRVLVALAAAALLGACTPYAGAYTYGYSETVSTAPVYSAPVYGAPVYDAPVYGGYAPRPYYAPPPVYAPRPPAFVGGGFVERDRYRYERPRDGGFRPPPDRGFGRPEPSGYARAPAPPPPGRPPVAPPAAAPRFAPGQPPPPPAGGPALEEWTRTHVNAAPSISDLSPSR